jgi:uncharacterized protein YgbK (DUF1537 family)
MSSTLDTSEINFRIDPSEITIIADDLAGACDTGIEFLETVGSVYEVCRRIGVKSLQLRQRISWGVVLTQAPDLSGMAIAVKGGSLGDVDAIKKVVDTVRFLA